MFGKKKNSNDEVTDAVRLVAHQLRAPLVALKFARERMQETIDSPTEEQQKLMTESSKRIAHINELVETLLSPLLLEKPELRIKETDKLEVFIDDILSEYASEAENLGVKLKSAYDWSPKTVKIDEAKLKEAVANIIDNAIKYTPKDGEVLVSVTADKKYVEITVADTGIGIPKDAKRRVFEKFSRLHNAQLHNTEGIGLGLFFSKKIIEAHGGEITYGQNIPQGSIFTIALPIAL